MLHSVIIPVRDRQAALGLCLRSLHASADYCAAKDWEVIVVDDNYDSDDYRIGKYFDPEGFNAKQYCVAKSQWFNKPRLLNIGISHAKGDVLTFLDADAIVAPLFMENPQRLCDDPALTKLCYRVRHLSAVDAEPLRTAHNYPTVIQKLFADYDKKRIRAEHYGQPDKGSWKRTSTPVFGNSQFSIRREVLGDLRFDERFKGRGYEDIHFNFLIWKHYYKTYRAEIVTDADHAMYHVENPPTGQEGWGPGAQNERNYRLYRQEFGNWKRAMKTKGVQI